MPIHTPAVQNLRRVFHEGFSAYDISEPLVSFDATSAAESIRSLMKEHGYEVVGVREEGVVIGYLNQSDLTDGPCADFVQSFDDNYVIAETDSLADVVLKLQETPRLFVSLLGCVGGIITRSDLQKPPVRMWLGTSLTYGQGSPGKHQKQH